MLQQTREDWIGSSLRIAQTEKVSTRPVGIPELICYQRGLVSGRSGGGLLPPLCSHWLEAASRKEP